MSDSGRLTVETGNSHLDEAYAATNPEVTPGQYVLIAITDTGSGMSSEIVAKAFDPFFTTKQIGRGTGLGLSQVHGFLKQSGGHVKLYSEVGVGTTVKLYLPRHTGPLEPGGVVAKPPRGDQGRDVMVLVVEDEVAVREFAVSGLIELGYQVLEAEDPAHALRLLDQRPEIALMLTDVVMPDVNGRQLAEQARKLRPALNVLYMTGYTRNAIVHNGVLDTGVRLLLKPFTIDQLEREMRSILADKLEASEA